MHDLTVNYIHLCVVGPKPLDPWTTLALLAPTSILFSQRREIFEPFAFEESCFYDLVEKSDEFVSVCLRCIHYQLISKGQTHLSSFKLNELS